MTAKADFRALAYVHALRAQGSKSSHIISPVTLSFFAFCDDAKGVKRIAYLRNARYLTIDKQGDIMKKKLFLED